MTALASRSDTLEDSVKPSKSAPRATAETMAAKQRDISVSEFFAKNRHLLGFDNPRKALLTTVKEAVDNSLDACEEAGLLPDITVVIEDLQPDRPASAKSSRYRVSVVDNGPGIVRKQVENVFGRLLFGSKFHRLKMSRGQQGIGISAAGMYGLITTGKPMVIHTKPKANSAAHHIELAMNTKTNRAEVTVDDETDDFPPRRFAGLVSGEAAATLLRPAEYPTGTSVSIELEGKYQRGRGSVDEFLELTAIANPHARITFVRPTRETAEEEDAPLIKRGKAAMPVPAPAADANAATEPPAQPQVTQDFGPLVLFPRGVQELPPETKEIMPHPKGIELGILLQMLKEAEIEKSGYTLYNFLQEKFSRVSPSSAADFCKSIGATSRTKVTDIDHAQAEKLFKELQDSKLPPPPTDCLAPIGVRQLLAGMLKGVRAEFYAASSREAAVYRGRPFLIETAIAFGGELPADDSSRVIRFANRVPLLFQQSACSSFKAVTETNWRNYDLQQPRTALPVGPLVIMIHMASVWVPFTSESKEAIADYDEIRKEMKLALMECGRKLGTYLRKRAKMKRESQRRDIFERYIGEIAKAAADITGDDPKHLYAALQRLAQAKTAIADIELDDEGKAVKHDEPDDEDGVIIVQSAVTGTDNADAPPAGGVSRAEAAALKVASLAKGDDDDQPALMETRPVERTSRKNASGKPAAKQAGSAKTPDKKPAPTKAASKPDAKPEAKPEAKTNAKSEKLRMRLNPKTGKLERVDEPKLF
ncbi:MAG: DNA topoisomerase VI subunit B [Planctomycetota bacterium]|nr:DNA topoisomerase VI subunit B [Planctomycetota bacterium]